MVFSKFLFKTSLLSIICLLPAIISCKSPGKYEEINIPNNLNDEGNINKLQNEEISPQKETILNEIEPTPEIKIEQSLEPKIETKIEPEVVVPPKTREEQIEEKAESLTTKLFDIYEKFPEEEKKKYDELPRADVKGSMKFLLGRGILGFNVKAQDLIITLGKYYSSPCGSWWNLLSCNVTGKKLAYIWAYQKASFDEKAKFKI